MRLEQTDLERVPGDLIEEEATDADLLRAFWGISQEQDWSTRTGLFFEDLDQGLTSQPSHAYPEEEYLGQSQPFSANWQDADLFGGAS